MPFNVYIYMNRPPFLWENFTSKFHPLVFFLLMLLQVLCVTEEVMRKRRTEGDPCRVSGKGGAREVSRGCGKQGGRRTNSTAVDAEGRGDDLTVECSGKHCKSCTAGLIADCVALCCCPCGLLNFLALAFVKVPWMVGRRCFGRVKRKRKKRLEMKRKSKRCSEGDQDCGGGEGEFVGVGEDGNYSRKGRVEGEFWEIVTGFGGEQEEVEMVGVGNVSARFEAERVWLEFYQVGHLGFGRVSYTGIQ